MPVPSFEDTGALKGGQRLEEVLQRLSEDVTVMGGNLPPMPRQAVDFLKDEHYLWENAAITAQCTAALIQAHWEDQSGAEVLIIGWGRIGKQLAALLAQAGGSVTVAARKEQDRLAAKAAGFGAVETGKWNPMQYDIIVNTAPARLLEQEDARLEALLVDLASVRGIGGDRVIWARGLPNKDAPEASGMLIAKTALRYALGKEYL